ncbi:TauD/TfdA family dioxygenase [Streptomyces sp. NPDC048436]|uniref:TauD/TfdA family dioxygenase n=1 Tax=Streptomyces sp. NPDC048436 TaxID=3365550 RepID=UPI003720100A
MLAHSAVPAAAERLEMVARDLAEDGVTPDAVLQLRPTPQRAAVVADLLPLLSPVPTADGYRVVPGLFEPFALDAGPTPAHWSEAGSARTAAFDIALVLAASAVGGVFGWVNQQDGRLVHNIVPSKGYERVQVGASSTAPLTCHTEDAFHPQRADLLMLVCVRNPEAIGTGVASIRRAAISDEEAAQLEKPLVQIMPDDSYGDWTAKSGTAPGAKTLWNGPDGRQLRYDPAYSRLLTDAPAFHNAYAALGAHLAACEETVRLHPGDAVLIDNDVAVHSRRSFKPRYDGSDRWLKRVLIRMDRPRPANENHESGHGQLPVEPPNVGANE